MTERLIDLPSPFASFEEWKEFLKEARTWPDGPDKQAAIMEAEAAIERLVRE